MPIALGNWWEVQNNFGKMKVIISALETTSSGEYEVTVTDSVLSSNGNRVTSTTYSSTDMGKLINTRGEHNKFAIKISPNHYLWKDLRSEFDWNSLFSMNVRDTTFNFLGETYESFAVYPNNGHMKTNAEFVAPGLGFMKLKDKKIDYYYLAPVPKAIAHEMQELSPLSQHTLLQTFWNANDSATLTFNMEASSCAIFEIANSWRPHDKALRIFVADTNQTTCPDSKVYQHTLTLTNIPDDAPLRILVFETYKKIKLYDEQVQFLRSVSTVSAGKQLHPTIKRGGSAFNIKGQTIIPFISKSLIKSYQKK